ncbi:unnamed protein product [Peniophora sp. CBMAI 1063]|nr:unnamed protein product [Peniophora sp. CBMAI 1063]
MDFAKIKSLFAMRLRSRGYPGKWIKSVFSEVSYTEMRPRALLPRPPLTEEQRANRLFVLKLTWNPVWEAVDFGPIWRTLRDAFEETGLASSSDRILASFKKPECLGDRLNGINRKTLVSYQAQVV